MDENFRTFIGCAQFVIGLVMLIVAALVGGTFRTEVTLIPEKGGTPVAADSFDEELQARHWLWGLVQGKQPDLQQALDRHLRPGERIGSLSLVTKHTWTDLLVTGVTLGIYAPKTVSVHGAIQRTEQPAEHEEGTESGDDRQPPLPVSAQAREAR